MKVILKRFFFAILVLAGVASVIAGIEYFGGQPMGLFSGTRPANLGFASGKFAPPSWKPNCVSSTVDKGDPHFIEPFALGGTQDDAWKRLREIVSGSPRVTIVNDQPNYLHAEFRSAGMGFVDDVEFALDERASVIQVRSASRLGVRDFGVNRNRIESLRAQYGRKSTAR